MASTLYKSNDVRWITNIPTVQASPDYSANDVMGGKQELANATDVARRGGVIRSVLVTDKAAVSGNVDILFFAQDPSNSTFTENGAVTLDDDDLVMLIGVVKLTIHTAYAASSSSQPTATPVELPFVLEGGTSLYAVMVARATFNLASTTDLMLKVGITSQ